MPKDRIIEVAGQRLTVTPFTDYCLESIKRLYDETGAISMSLKRHSEFLENAIDVIPGFPANLYKLVGDRYRWLGTMEAFSELILGLWTSYWEWESEAAIAAKDEGRMAIANQQLEIIKRAKSVKEPTQAEPEEIIGDPYEGDLMAELVELRAKVQG
jgi:hypothetical protein